MVIFFGVNRKTTDMGVFTINCPICGSQNCRANFWIMREILYLFYFIPVWSNKIGWVKCSGCFESMTYVGSMLDIDNLTTESRSAFIRYKMASFERLCAWLTLPLSLIPVVGLIFSLVIRKKIYGKKGFLPTLVTFSLCLSIAITMSVIYVFFFL